MEDLENGRFLDGRNTSSETYLANIQEADKERSEVE